MNIIEAIEKEQLKKEPSAFSPGDTVRVYEKIVEGGKERTQVFEGIVLGKEHGGVRETFTVRKISYGMGIERIFPFHSPAIDKIEVIKQGKVRRAKLYYLRKKVGKAMRIKEKRVERKRKVEGKATPRKEVEENAEVRKETVE